MNALQTTTRAPRHNTRRPGMTLIESMISLSIAAMLLVAVAAAYQASASAITMNDTFFRSSQAGRVSMNQLLTEIRRADAVQVTGSTSVDIIRPTETLTPNEVHRTFTYDSAGQKITL